MGDVTRLVNNTDLASTAVMAGLGQTLASITIFRLDGRLLYANPQFAKNYEQATGTHVQETIGTPLWQVWQLEAQLTIDTRCPLRYIAEIGKDEQGRILSSRCREWHEGQVTPLRTIYAETIPISVRRQLVMRVSIPLTEVLRHIPEDFDPNATITQQIKSPL